MSINSAIPSNPWSQPPSLASKTLMTPSSSLVGSSVTPSIERSSSSFNMLNTTSNKRSTRTVVITVDVTITTWVPDSSFCANLTNEICRWQLSSDVTHTSTPTQTFEPEDIIYVWPVKWDTLPATDGMKKCLSTLSFLSFVSKVHLSESRHSCSQLASRKMEALQCAWGSKGKAHLRVWHSWECWVSHVLLPITSHLKIIQVLTTLM